MTARLTASGHCKANARQIAVFFRIKGRSGAYDDMGSLPLSLRKTNLARLLARRSDGNFSSRRSSRARSGRDLFRAACKMGLEGLISKHLDRPYRAG
jgi:ATP-dependent DNA ligase